MNCYFGTLYFPKLWQYGWNYWRPSLSICLARLFLLQNRFFCPHTANSQPIWIKFCTRLLLYGIHLWADLDWDRHGGGSRPNQNDYAFFVILVTHPMSYIETMDYRDFGGRPSSVIFQLKLLNVAVADWLQLMTTKWFTSWRHIRDLAFYDVYSLWLSHTLLANMSQYIHINSVRKFSALFNNIVDKCCLHSFCYILWIYFHSSTWHLHIVSIP